MQMLSPRVACTCRALTPASWLRSQRHSVPRARADAPVCAAVSRAIRPRRPGVLWIGSSRSSTGGLAAPGAVLEPGRPGSRSRHVGVSQGVPVGHLQKRLAVLPQRALVTYPVFDKRRARRS